MKYLVFICVLSFVGLCFAQSSEEHPRGCIYVLGRCYRECEEGTHAYTTGCGKKTPERSCDNLNPQEEEGNICDYSACYCDAPTVRDPVSKKCVKVEDCPKTPGTIKCEEGTHAYTTGCGKKTPEKTCDNLEPKEEEGIICDYAACYCDEPTVRDPVSNKCVKVEDCPKKA